MGADRSARALTSCFTVPKVKRAEGERPKKDTAHLRILMDHDLSAIPEDAWSMPSLTFINPNMRALKPERN